MPAGTPSEVAARIVHVAQLLLLEPGLRLARCALGHDEGAHPVLDQVLVHLVQVAISILILANHVKVLLLCEGQLGGALCPHSVAHVREETQGKEEHADDEDRGAVDYLVEVAVGRQHTDDVVAFVGLDLLFGELLNDGGVLAQARADEVVRAEVKHLERLDACTRGSLSGGGQTHNFSVSSHLVESAGG